MSNLQNFAKEISTKLNEINQQVKKDGKNVIQSTAIELFDKFPILTGIKWTQYTPYFNDGDACEFGIGDLNYSFKISQEFFNKKLKELEEVYESCLNGTIKIDKYSSREYEERRARAEFLEFKDSGLEQWSDKYELSDFYDSNEVKQIEKAINEFVKAINELNEKMEIIFGNHVEVSISKNGIETNDYEHD